MFLILPLFFSAAQPLISIPSDPVFQLSLLPYTGIPNVLSLLAFPALRFSKGRH